MQIEKFSDLNLSPRLLATLAEEDFIIPTPIQAQAIPALLEGRDLLGCAQTGTGKTAAFALPILERLSKSRERRISRVARALVLSPTRELAIQIADACEQLGRGLGLKIARVYGGVGQNPQVYAMQRGVDILVATPGRLLDLMGQGHIVLDRLEVFVLDEADRMLDMGFAPDVKRVIKVLPRQRQSMFFSATLPPAAVELANSLLRDPVMISVTPDQPTVENVDQRVMFVDTADKWSLLRDLLDDDGEFARALVFTRTRHGANRIVRKLTAAGIGAEAIHGDKSQSARQRALKQFRNGATRILVATDIAARGIDVDDISHVINYELPNVPESYVHRIGRTARAGASGIAISLCDAEEKAYLRDIEKLIKQPVPVDPNHSWHVEHPEPGHGRKGKGASANRRPGFGRPSGSSGHQRRSSTGGSAQGRNHWKSRTRAGRL